MGRVVQHATHTTLPTLTQTPARIIHHTWTLSRHTCQSGSHSIMTLTWYMCLSGSHYTWTLSRHTCQSRSHSLWSMCLPLCRPRFHFIWTLSPYVSRPGSRSHLTLCLPMYKTGCTAHQKHFTHTHSCLERWSGAGAYLSPARPIGCIIHPAGSVPTPASSQLSWDTFSSTASCLSLSLQQQQQATVQMPSHTLWALASVLLDPCAVQGPAGSSRQPQLPRCGPPLSPNLSAAAQQLLPPTNSHLRASLQLPIPLSLSRRPASPEPQGPGQ
jgi:hypothetical protein